MHRKDRAGMRYRALDFSVKAVDEKGTFSGYASVYGVVDTYRERVAAGAFADSLAEIEAAGRRLPVIWQHDLTAPIGVWTHLREDERGLHAEGALWLDDAPIARIARRGMMDRAVTGLSIGYWIRADSFDEVERVRTLTSVDLREISVVVDPANDEARIDVVKAKLASGETPTDREFARVLRERGFSRSQADAIADVGFKAWSAGAGRPQANSKAELSVLAAEIGGLRLPKF